MLEQDKGLRLPKRMQADFALYVQRMADELGRELGAADIWDAFRRAYFVKIEPRHFRLVDYEERKTTDGTRLFSGTIAVEGQETIVSGRGNGLISSVVATMQESFGIALEVRDYIEHALGAGSDARAAAFVECLMLDGRTIWGCGIDTDVATASVRAVISVANQWAARGNAPS